MSVFKYLTGSDGGGGGSTDTLDDVASRGSTTTSAITINNNTASTDDSTGALIVAGGVGIGGDVNVGGDLAVTGNISGKIDAGDITSGTINTARLGSGTANNTTFLRGDGSWQAISLTESDTLASVTGRGATTSVAISITNNTASTNTTSGALVVTGGVGVGGNVNVGGNLAVTGNISGKIDAGDIASGTINTARLGSGTADNTTYLRGDGSWQTISFTESDTLASVTGRGASTSDAITISNNTASTNTSSGALIVSGGVGIGGAVNIGGNASVAGDLSVTGSISGKIDASNIDSGTISAARLGSGTADNTTYLRGDGTWAPVAVGSPLVSLTDDTTIDTDCSLGTTFRVVLGGDRLLANPTNMVSGVRYIWIIRQDASGGRTLTFGDKFLFDGGAPPDLSTDPNAVDVLVGIYDGVSDEILCALGGKGFAALSP